MKILQNIALLVIALLIQGCEPIPFNTEDGDPEFTINMNIGGEEFIFDAGVDDFFMQTEVLNLGPTKYFGSLLRKVNGQLIEDELALTISFQVGEEVNNSTSADHINSFKTGIIPYNTLDDAALPIKEVVFSGDYNGTGSNIRYLWDYGDGLTVEYDNPIHAYADLGTYSATLTVADENQCSASTTNTVTFDNREDCVATIAVTNVSTSGAILESSSNGLAPYQYSWSNGTSESDVAIDVSNETSLQEHCVTVTDANDCVSVNCIGIIKNTDGTVNTCAASMTESNYTRAIRAKQFNSVEIFWKDENGEEYASRDVFQGDDSSFEILSFEEYDMNDQGQRTVKVEFVFSCTLYLTGGTDPIRVENAKGTIAVAIP